MNCIDCGEELKTYEFRDKRHCSSCRGVMHFECTMTTSTENDVCEACLAQSDERFRQAMEARANRTNGSDDEC